MGVFQQTQQINLKYATTQTITKINQINKKIGHINFGDEIETL
jgi:hypothetical protein